MLKLIPQEEPDKKRKRRSKSQPKRRRKQTKDRAQKQQNTNSKKKCVLTDTYEHLITYANEPNKHTDREISAIILSMHRSILHLEQARLKKRNKRRGK